MFVKQIIMEFAKKLFAVILPDIILFIKNKIWKKKDEKK